MICVNSRCIGTSRHLMMDSAGAFLWVDECSGNSWTWGFEDSDKRIEDISEMFRTPVQDLIPQAQKDAINIVLPNLSMNVPWNYVLGKHEFNTRLKSFLNNLFQFIQAVEDSGYRDTYFITRKFLKSLSGGLIDEPKLHQYLQCETNPTILSILNSFKPTESGNTRTIEYNLTSTSTGRSIVKKGPRILTLPVKYRDILSHTPQHTLVQLDFISLEPRVALYLTGNNSNASDIYGYINDTLFSGKLNRPQMKIATLCALYGVSALRLKKIMGGNDSNMIIKKIKDFFSVVSQVTEMKKHLTKTNFLQNFFGRPLFFENTSDHLLFSHFIQSTAVDVAMLGFCELQRIMSSEGIFMKPIFVIHDALILEIKNQSIDKVKEMCRKGIEVDRMGNFPLSFQILSMENE